MTTATYACNDCHHYHCYTTCDETISFAVPIQINVKKTYRVSHYKDVTRWEAYIEEYTTTESKLIYYNSLEKCAYIPEIVTKTRLSHRMVTEKKLVWEDEPYTEKEWTTINTSRSCSCEHCSCSRCKINITALMSFYDPSLFRPPTPEPTINTNLLSSIDFSVMLSLSQTTYKDVLKTWCLDFTRPQSQRQFARRNRKYEYIGEGICLAKDDAERRLNIMYRTARKVLVLTVPFVGALFCQHPVTIANGLMISGTAIIGFLNTQYEEIFFNPTGIKKVAMGILQNVGLAMVGNALSWGIKTLF